MKSKSMNADVQQRVREGAGEKVGTIRLDEALIRSLMREFEGAKYVSADDFVEAISKAARAAAKRMAHLSYEVGFGIPVENCRKLLLSILAFRGPQKELGEDAEGEPQTENEMQHLAAANAEAFKVAQAINDHISRSGEAPHWEFVQSLLAEVPDRPLVERILWNSKSDDPTIVLANRDRMPKIPPPPRDLSSNQNHSVVLAVDGVHDSAAFADVVIVQGLGEVPVGAAIQDLVGQVVPLKLDEDQGMARDLLVAAQLNHSPLEASICVSRGMRAKDRHRTLLHLSSLSPRPGLVVGVKRRMEQMALEFETVDEVVPYANASFEPESGRGVRGD